MGSWKRSWSQNLNSSAMRYQCQRLHVLHTNGLFAMCQHSTGNGECASKLALRRLRLAAGGQIIIIERQD